MKSFDSLQGRHVRYKGVAAIVNVAHFPDARGTHVYLNPTRAGFRSAAYRRMKRHVGTDFDFDVTHDRKALAEIRRQARRRATHHRATK